MKTKSLLALLLFTGFSVNAFSQASWAWARVVGGVNNDYPCSVAADSLGNSYSTGSFDGPSITFGSTTLTTSSSNYFLVKHDPAGNPVWARSASPSTPVEAFTVASDRAGNTCVSGYFSGSMLVIDSDTLYGVSSEIFIAKYDAAGNLLWAKSAGGTGADVTQSVHLDEAGNCFVTGYFRSPTLNFGAITLTNSDNSGLTSDLFLAKYDANGNVLWAISNGENSVHEFGEGVTTDANGNYFLTGIFLGPTITFGSTTLTNTGTYGDVYLVKFDPTGNILWAKRAGSGAGDMCIDVSIDPFGNCFIAGYFSGPTMNFGSSAISNSSSNAEDGFIAKYDASGNFSWARKIGGNKSDYALSISTDSYGNSFVAGAFNSASLVFGPSTLTNANNSGNTSDIYLAKFDSLGNALWGKSSGGNAHDKAADVVIDEFNVCYIVGYFISPSVTFGSFTLTNATSSGNSEDGFLARLEDVTGVAPFANENNYIPVFPNPSNAVFTIDPAITEGTIYVSDVFGKIILRSDIVSNGSSIDLSGQANGIYFIRVNTGAESIAQKLILQK